MSQRDKDLRLLELSDEATVVQIAQAYHQLLARYGPGRLASYGLLRAEERKTLLYALEAAYQRLSAPADTMSPPPTRAPLPDTTDKEMDHD